MRRTVLIPLILLTLLLAPAALAAPDAELTAELDRLFSEAYPADGPGAAVLVQRGEHVLLRKAYGMADLELGVALAPDMVFRLGSITKQFTAVAVLMLEQEGKLAVGDDITRHLPDYPTHGKTITIEHLLTHTSGIPSYTGIPGWMEKVRDDRSVEEMIAGWQDLPLEFDPGAEYRYNNSGYFLLGAVIEAASGMSYETFIEQRIFAPLGMESSFYGDNRQVIPRRARGYHRDGDTYVNAPYLSMSQPFAAGSLLSTVDDLARWDAALYTDQLLPAAARERLWNDTRLTSGEETGYGYGWMLQVFDGRRVISHGGGIFGFATHALQIPQDRVFVAVLSNNPNHQPGPSSLVQRATSALYGHPHQLEAVEVDPATLDQYAAVYRISDEETRVVTVEDGRLATQRAGGGKFAALPLGEDRFFYEGSLTRFWFERDTAGAITAMVMQPWGSQGSRAERTDEPLPAPPEIAQVDPALYDAYAGDYELMPGFVLTVWRDAGKLMTRATGQQEIEILPESETVFNNTDIGARITFERGADGQAVGLVLEQGGQTMRAKRSE